MQFLGGKHIKQSCRKSRRMLSSKKQFLSSMVLMKASGQRPQHSAKIQKIEKQAESIGLEIFFTDKKILMTSPHIYKSQNKFFLTSQKTFFKNRNLKCLLRVIFPVISCTRSLHVNFSIKDQFSSKTRKQKNRLVLTMKMQKKREKLFLFNPCCLSRQRDN